MSQQTLSEYTLLIGTILLENEKLRIRRFLQQSNDIT